MTETQPKLPKDYEEYINEYFGLDYVKEEINKRIEKGRMEGKRDAYEHLKESIERTCKACREAYEDVCTTCYIMTFKEEIRKELTK